MGMHSLPQTNCVVLWNTWAPTDIILHWRTNHKFRSWYGNDHEWSHLFWLNIYSTTFIIIVIGKKWDKNFNILNAGWWICFFYFLVLPGYSSKQHSQIIYHDKHKCWSMWKKLCMTDVWWYFAQPQGKTNFIWLTKLLDGSVCAPRQLQGHVDSPPLVLNPLVSLQGNPRTCSLRYDSHQLEKGKRAELQVEG